MTQNSKTEDDTIDLKELFFSLIAQWKTIALCIILSLICALLYIRTTPSIYSTDALVQVERQKCCIIRRTQRSLWWSWSKIACRCRD
jgi:tyrosine-protein kinase Etk/Wzc